jgi:hypothetical protein
MAISAFSDKTKPPEETDLHATLGPRLEWWQRITTFMLASYQLPGLLQYGGKNYGWHLYYKRASKPLLSLYPQEAGLVAQVVLGKIEIEKAAALTLGETVAKALRETPGLHDGKWLFLQPQSGADIEDILQLILTKAKPKKG